MRRIAQDFQFPQVFCSFEDIRDASEEEDKSLSLVVCGLSLC